MRKLLIMMAVLVAMLGLAAPAFAQVNLSPGDEGPDVIGEEPETDVEDEEDVADVSDDDVSDDEDAVAVSDDKDGEDVAAGEQLAATGVDLMQGLLLAGALVILGGGLLMLSRRAKRGAGA